MRHVEGQLVIPVKSYFFSCGKGNGVPSYHFGHTSLFFHNADQ